MLKMDQVSVIRHKVLKEGLSRRQVAEQMGVSRNTVRKYIDDVSEPVFKKSKHRKTKVLQVVGPRIDALLEEWASVSGGKHKITGQRIFEQLKSEGIDVGVTTVRKYLRQKKLTSKETYIPLLHTKGDSAQVDFFEVSVDINGTRKKVWMFVMRLMYSGRDFVWLYERCNQESFLDAHVRAFAHFGGIPKRCVYDNLKAAVKKILKLGGRQLSPRFMALVSHYVFEPSFCRPYQGHDKGGVESRGKHIRYQHMVPICSGQDLSTISTQLLSDIDSRAFYKKDKKGRLVMDKFNEEKTVLSPLPSRAFEPRLTKILVPNHQSLVSYDRSSYSLPSHWKFLQVHAYIGPDDIRFVCGDEVVVRARCHRKQANIVYRDYLAELKKKPQAVRQVAPQLMVELGKPFEKLWQLLEESYSGKEAGRLVAKILQAVIDHGENKVCQGIDDILNADKTDLLALGRLFSSSNTPHIDVPEALQQFVVESVSASSYDSILAELGGIS